jgi:hypothetical protein
VHDQQLGELLMLQYQLASGAQCAHPKGNNVLLTETPLAQAAGCVPSPIQPPLNPTLKVWGGSGALLVSLPHTCSPAGMPPNVGM